MELNYIREFVVLAEVGNFLEASESLFISQSSLSKHIKVLEHELGVTLFDRTTRKVHLNEYGRTFLTYAKEIARVQYEYKTALINKQEDIYQTITLGSIPVMAPYRITDIIIKFKQENKKFSVNFIEGDSFDLKMMLRQDKCELAFIRESKSDDDEFTKIAFTNDTLSVVLPAYHPLAKEKKIRIEQLRGEDFLLLQPNTMLYHICLDECQRAGFTPNIAFTGQRAENIVDLIEKGMGISLLMRKPIEYLSSDKIKIVDIEPAITTDIKLYYKKEKELTIAAKHFIECVQLQKMKTDRMQ